MKYFNEKTSDVLITLVIFIRRATSARHNRSDIHKLTAQTVYHTYINIIF